MNSVTMNFLSRGLKSSCLKSLGLKSPGQGSLLKGIDNKTDTKDKDLENCTLCFLLSNTQLNIFFIKQLIYNCTKLLYSKFLKFSMDQNLMKQSCCQRDSLVDTIQDFRSKLGMKL